MKILKLHFNSVILNVLNFGLIYIKDLDPPK